MTQFKHGKLCKKHPEAEGKRYSPSGNCVMCARDHSREQYARNRGEGFIRRGGDGIISQEEAQSLRVAMVVIEQCLLPDKNGMKMSDRDRLEAIRFHVERALQRDIEVEQ